MQTGSDTTSLPLPSSLLAQVQATADEEHRTTGEVVQEAVERYLRDRRWQRTLAYGQERAATLGLTEADVPRLIAESRQERRQKRAGD